MKVLIADDELVYLKIVEKMICGWGYNVVKVSDGKQAWKLLESDSSIHIALLDWMMPGMDGLEICKLVRQREGMPYVALLIMSARDQQSDIDQGYLAGVDDYLVKPVNSSQLKQRLLVAERVVKMERELRNSSEVMTRLVSSLGRGQESTRTSAITQDLPLCLSLALASCKYALKPYAHVVQTQVPPTKELSPIKTPAVKGDSQRLEEVLVRIILDSAEAIKGNAKGNLYITTSFVDANIQIIFEDDIAPKFHGDLNFQNDLQRLLELQSAQLLIEPSSRGGLRFAVTFTAA